MKIRKEYAVIFKIIFVFIGLFSLIKIIKNYGFNIIVDEVNRSGFLLVFLALTFIPTLVCYAISWLLATEHQRMSDSLSNIHKIIIFIKMTIASIAWNNLTPFLKVGGEPLKYMMLSSYLPKREALTSTINYNVIHLLATGISFVVTSLLLVIFYDPPNDVRFYLLGFAMIASLMLYLFFLIIRTKFVFIRGPLIFYKKNPRAFFYSLLFDVIARFVEGLTFYFGFYLIKRPLSFLSSSLLDVGRSFVDTIFFFVPYQIGSREEGVHFFMEKILIMDSKGFLTAVFLYRFVEIFWILIGYLIWVSTKSSSKEARV